MKWDSGKSKQGVLEIGAFFHGFKCARKRFYGRAIDSAQKKRQDFSAFEIIWSIAVPHKWNQRQNASHFRELWG
jgi:hypothetical protein